MKCPVCTEPDLVMTERQGVEIDYCPKCRGVWLDRGELDKILERASTQPLPSPTSSTGYQDSRSPRKDDYRRDDHHHYGRKRRESWLSELFD